MTRYKLKCFADLSAWSDDPVEARLQDLARLLSREGASDEQIAEEVAYLRAQLNEVRAEWIRNSRGPSDRDGATLQ
jgi:hypothetical protein